MLVILDDLGLSWDWDWDWVEIHVFSTYSWGVVIAVLVCISGRSCGVLDDFPTFDSLSIFVGDVRLFWMVTFGDSLSTS